MCAMRRHWQKSANFRWPDIVTWAISNTQIGLENRQAGNRLVGSNPTPSANIESVRPGNGAVVARLTLEPDVPANTILLRNAYFR